MSTYNENKVTLSRYFPEEISILILDFKTSVESIEVRDEMIERDFYNWLNYDLCLRNSYRHGFFTNRHCEYYIQHFKKLGLNSITDKFDNLRRTTSLNECFKQKWWKTTRKNSIEWKKIHKHIQMSRQDFISIWHMEREYNRDDVFNTLSYNWYTPTIEEKLVLIFYFDYELLEKAYENWLATEIPMFISWNNDIL